MGSQNLSHTSQSRVWRRTKRSAHCSPANRTCHVCAYHQHASPCSRNILLDQQYAGVLEAARGFAGYLHVLTCYTLPFLFSCLLLSLTFVPCVAAVPVFDRAEGPLACLKAYRGMQRGGAG